MPKRHSQREHRGAGFSGAKLGRLAAVVLAGLLLALGVASLFALVAPELMAPANAQPQREPNLAAGLFFGSEAAGEVYKAPLVGSGVEVTVKGDRPCQRCSAFPQPH